MVMENLAQRFLEVLYSVPTTKLDLITVEPFPKFFYIQFDASGLPLFLRFGTKEFRFLHFDTVNRESNPRAIFIREKDKGMFQRMDIPFYGQIPPNFKITQCYNMTTIEGEITDYDGSWVAKNQWLVTPLK